MTTYLRAVPLCSTSCGDPVHTTLSLHPGAPLVAANQPPFAQLPLQDGTELQTRSLALGSHPQQQQQQGSGRNRAGSASAMPMFGGGGGSAQDAPGAPSQEGGTRKGTSDPWRSALSLTLFWDASGPAGGNDVSISSSGNGTDGSGKMTGQHHALHIFPQRSDAEDAVLAFGLEHDSAIEFDFAGPENGALPVCTVPVTLTVRNCSEETEATAVRFLGFPPEALDEDASQATVRSPYFWGGSSTRVIADRLSPGEVVSIKLHACFLAASVYQLNRFRISAVFPGGTRPMVFAPSNPSFISVVGSSGSSSSKGE